MAPARDFTWLAEIQKDLALVARPRSRFDRLVLTKVLVQAGLKLIDEAERSAKLPKLARACRARNGLMVALLAFCPIRRKNFAALEIGRSFVKFGVNGVSFFRPLRPRRNEPTSARLMNCSLVSLTAT